MSAGSDDQTDRGKDRQMAFFDLFDPGFQPDAPAVLAAREACWYARTPLGYAVLRFLAEFAREPDAYLGFLALGMTMGQWLCVPMFLGGIGLFLWSRRSTRS